MNNIQFFIPKTPTSLNIMLRQKWDDRYREQAAWDLHVLAQWMARGKFIFFKPVKILYTIRFSTNRVRDFDNYMGGTKYLTDALKRTFLTRDDSSWLKEIRIAFERGTPGTEVLIEEA